MTVAEDLGERICAISTDRLSPEAVHWAKVSILDTVGVALAGTREPCAQIAGGVIAGTDGPSLVFGTRRRAAALDAAQINGAAAHALDFDASNNTMAGHPSVHILPALYALAEELGSDGAAFVTAYVAGFETQCRLARGLQPYQTTKGWFPSSSLGVLGTAAAVSHLLRLTPNQTAQALGLAANLASGLIINAGTMTKPFLAGHAARNGLLAGLLVQRGFTAALDSLDNPRGYFRLFNDPGEYDIAPMLAGWGDPYEVLETAVGLKQHPCCGVLQSTVDIIANMVRDHKLTPDHVEKVDVLLVSKRVGHVDRPHPRSGTDAKFSTQYCVARTLEHGRLAIDDFEGAAYQDAPTHAVMTRVSVAEHPSTTADRHAQGGVEVQVTTRDGQHLSESARQPFGRIPGKPLPENLLHAKFLDCATRALTRTDAERVLGLLTRVESLGSIGEISDAMLGAG